MVSSLFILGVRAGLRNVGGISHALSQDCHDIELFPFKIYALSTKVVVYNFFLLFDGFGLP